MIKSKFIYDSLITLGLREKPVYDILPKFEHLCDITEITKRKDIGFTLTGKKEFTNLDTATKNALIAGVSGTGKSQNIIIPNLLFANRKCSFVVHDASGEIRKMTSGYLKSIGYDIHVIDLFNPSSTGYNPLLHIDKGLSAAKQLAQVIVHSSLGKPEGNNMFWNSRAESVIAVLIGITNELPTEYRHIKTVLYFLNQLASNPQGMDLFVVQNIKDRQIIDEYKSNIVAIDVKLFGNIKSTAEAALSAFQDETIQNILTGNDLDFTKIRQAPTVIFLESSVMKAEYTAPIFSVILHQLMEYLLSYIPSKEELPVKLLLDEFPILRISGMPGFIANSRKHKVACLLSCQSSVQLTAKFGNEHAQSIMANCNTHVYFTNSPMESCEQLSRHCGKVKFVTEEKEREDWLFRPEEIRLLPRDHVLILTAGHKPILAHIRPAYKSYMMRKRMNMPPVEPCLNTTTNTPVLIPKLPKVNKK